MHCDGDYESEFNSKVHLISAACAIALLLLNDSSTAWEGGEPVCEKVNHIFQQEIGPCEQHMNTRNRRRKDVSLPEKQTNTTQAVVQWMIVELIGCLAPHKRQIPLLHTHFFAYLFLEHSSCSCYSCYFLLLLLLLHPPSLLSLRASWSTKWDQKRAQLAVTGLDGRMEEMKRRADEITSDIHYNK